MSSKIETYNILSDTQYVCFVVPSLFSKDECDKLLTTELKNKFQKAIINYPTYYRNNERLVIDDPDLSNILFEKVKPYLPEIVHVSLNIGSENGIWYLKELNNRLRFCKYSANQYFHKHLDGIHYHSETVQSKLTFMIYLNDAAEFDGGRTLFYKTKESTEIWASYIPKCGDLIVFDHNLWHEGEVLTKGEKFVLRSDILYSKAENTIEQIPFYGHLGYIWSLLKFDENIILSGGRDKEIKVWNSSGELKQSLKEHSNSILCLEKINDKTFVSGSRDQHIIIWRKQFDYDFLLSNKIHIHSAVVLSLCKLTDTTFASSSGDNSVIISNIEGHSLQIFSEHNNWVWKVIRLSENILATASEDCTIKIWNVKLGKSIQTFEEKNTILSLVYNQETKQLINGNLLGEISIRTLKNDFSSQDLKSFKAHNGIIRTIKYIDDIHIATGGEDNKIRIWNIESGQLTRELEHHNFIQAIELLDNNRLLSASYDGTIKMWTL